MLLVGLLTGQSSNPGRGDFFQVLTFPDRLWGQSSLHLNGYQIFFPAAKRPERDAGQAPLSSAEVESKWSYTLHLATSCASITFAEQNYLNFNEWSDSTIQYPIQGIGSRHYLIWSNIREFASRNWRNSRNLSAIVADVSTSHQISTSRQCYEDYCFLECNVFADW